MYIVPLSFFYRKEPGTESLRHRGGAVEEAMCFSPSIIKSKPLWGKCGGGMDDGCY